MMTPTHNPQIEQDDERTLGALLAPDILDILEESSLSMTGLWLQVSERRQASPMTRVSYDWFVLALDLLYALGTVELSSRGLVRRSVQ